MRLLSLIIRLEEKKDWREVELLTREAFWRQERIEKLGIGCDEHYLVHTLRSSSDFISELDFVAELDGELVGNIMYSRGYVLISEGRKQEVIGFGPVSVLPKHQKCGIGSALIRHSLRVATEIGYGAVIIYGHPTYYPRFGFKEAKVFNITTHDGKSFPAFMAMELIEGSLKGISGSFQESPLYFVDPEKAREYDKQFLLK